MVFRPNLGLKYHWQTGIWHYKGHLDLPNPREVKEHLRRNRVTKQNFLDAIASLHLGYESKSVITYPFFIQNHCKMLLYLC